MATIENELSALDRRLTALRIDYDRFFAGELKAPPLAARRQLEDFLRRLGNAEVDRAADRFRLQSLEGRYSALCELWEKRQSAREEGRMTAGARPKEADAAPEPPDAGAAAPVKQRRRVDLTPLFQKYVAARSALGEDVSRLRYEKFEELVRKQAQEIQKKTGCSRLVFEVQTNDGRVRLLGRPAVPKGTERS